MPDQDGSWRISTYEAAHRVFAGLEGDPDGDEANADRAADGTDLPIPGYRIDRLIGRGGGGVVYHGYRDGSERPVAIKRLNRRLGESSSRARAWRELDVLNSVRLDCLPHLYDYGEVDGRLYIVTDFIEGEPLDRHCAKRGLGYAGRVDCLLTVAEAVHRLHEVGVIHRDLKPDNIIITSQGQPMLLDLGIALLDADDMFETLSEEGQPVGSPAFMAPEQARGERHRISTRSDVYALGAMAYLLLTGETPHDMNTSLHEAIRRVSQDPPRDPRDLRPDLPKPLAAVLSKAVAPDPSERYASAAALAADLSRWRAGQAVEAGSPSIWRRAGRVMARYPRTATAAACLAIAASVFLGSTATVWWMNVRPHALEIDPDQASWARLVSYGGRTLHRWETGRRNGVLFAEFVRSGGVFGDEPLLLFGFSNRANHDDAGRLAAYRLSNLDEPIWRTGRAEPDFVMPSDYPEHFERENARFRLVSAQLADVFPDVPGPQVIGIYAHDRLSPSLVRVHALDGEVLYEAWQLGRIYDAQWLPATGRLLLAGLDSHALWSERGYENPPRRPWPIIIMAVEPTLRAPNMLDEMRSSSEIGFDPVWHSALLPPATQEYFDAGRMTLQPSTLDPDRTVAWNIPAREPYEGSITFHVTADGEIQSLTLNDAYRLDDHVPTREQLVLGPLPPIVNEPSGNGR